MLVWFFVCPSAFAKKDVTLCEVDTSILYLPMGTLSDAMVNFYTNFTDYCDVGMASKVCSFSPVSNAASSAFDNLGLDQIGDLLVTNFAGTVNFTGFEEERASELAAYKEACGSAAHSKFCHISTGVRISLQVFMIPFALDVAIIGIPFCFASSCSDSDLVKLASIENDPILSLLQSLPGVTMINIITQETLATCA